MNETSRRQLGRITQGLRVAARTLGLYLDDLLLLAGGALATAGACLTAYAVVVARSRGGGRR